MSVSVSMPQLGESVTEGTVTRWLKKEGERVEVDEPLLEVSTDKVDTEIPSPASGILRGISVDEDETVAVGAQLAVIDDGASGDAAPGTDDSASAAPAEAAQPAPAQDDSAQDDSAQTASAQDDSAQADSAQTASAQDDSAQDDSAQPAAAQAEQAPADSDGWSPQGSQPNYAPPAQSSPAASSGYPGSSEPSTPAYAPPPAYGQQQSRPYGQPAPAADAAPAAESAPAPAAQVPAQGQPAAEESAPAAPAAAEAQAEEYPPPTPLPSAGDAPYVTPLVRKLAAEHAVDLESVTGTGVGGRIRKQDVIEAARAQRAAQPAQPPAPAQPAQPSQPAQPAAQAQAPQPGQPQPQPPQQARPAPGAPRPAVVPSSLRGTTQRMSRPRQVIAQRMVESLHVSAQLTTVVEADVTAIARLRDQARQDFEAREGVKLSFLPFFALAAVEALKVQPKLNAVIDADQVTYHDAEHLGIAVDTERGLMVPVIHNAGDLNIGGLARKISDLASRTRSSQVAPDELAGGTFTLTNTGSRGALFDTPIINQPQVAILGTGTVVKRPVVVTDPAFGEVIAVRSMVYLALTYDHRLVDGADAARFLTTVKSRLEEGAFEAELGL
jgi:pyruvate dehydrogenase E2 component (dihydrolipoamide acetyltransferase)